MAEIREPALIVGAGPIGLTCAIAGRRRGLDPLVIDAGAVCASIVRYPVGMIFFTSPERLEIGGHPLACAGPKPTREEALMYYRGVVRAEGLRVRPYTKLVGVERAGEVLRCRVQRTLGEPGVDVIEADRLVLATGYFDHPNRLGVPGEELPHVSHYMEEAHHLGGLDVVVVGGKNSAAEQALAAFRAGARVTLVHRGAGVHPRVKYWLRPDLENRIKASEITARWHTVVEEITTRAARVRDRSGVEHLPADRVFLLTGFQPDFELLRRIGIALEPGSMRPEHNAETLETNVPGVYVAGSLTSGTAISEVFIENGRFDGERIFGDPESRRRARAEAERVRRPVGE